MSNLASTKNQREYILLDTWFSLDVVGVFLREASIWLAFNVTISTSPFCLFYGNVLFLQHYILLVRDCKLVFFRLSFVWEWDKDEVGYPTTSSLCLVRPLDRNILLRCCPLLSLNI